MTEDYLSNTIQRCPHDRENPYAQINRDLIRDKSISPECRWLLIYLLSMKDGWKIKITQIHEHVAEFIGINKVYRLIRECIEAGYIKKVVTFKGNLRQHISYIVSESPKFKECFRSDDSGDVGQGHVVKSDYKKEHSLKNDQEEKKSPTSSSPPPQAVELSIFLLEAIKKTKPDLKKPNIDRWAQQIDLMIRIDKRLPENIKKVIDWLPTDDFWKDKLLSAEKLRQKFDMLELKMRQKTSNSITGDLGLIKKLETRKDLTSSGKLIVGPKYVEFPHSRVYLEAGSKDFRERLIENLKLIGVKIT
jgi:hypothetical protein